MGVFGLSPEAVNKPKTKILHRMEYIHRIPGNFYQGGRRVA